MSYDIKEATETIVNEIEKVILDPSKIKQNGCAACHVLFNIIERFGLDESDASSLLSETLSHNPDINEKFIEMIEYIHMKQRMQAIPFALKSRESKDRIISSDLKSVIDDMQFELVRNGPYPLIRRLMVTNIALNLAQSIGIDYHAALEEVYYFIRKNNKDVETIFGGCILKLQEKISSTQNP